MKHFLFISLSIFLLTFPLNAEISVPIFTPNVVDSTSSLPASDITEINSTIEEVRIESNILSAVYIVDSLQGESIESLAVRTFEKWKLGMKGVDNGLLLVISMQDRKNKIETGYGLEGDLPDLVVKRVLDTIFREHMRAGNAKLAITETLKTLSKVRVKQIPTEQFTSQTSNNTDDIRWDQGLKAWAVYAFLLLATGPIYGFFRKRKINALITQLSGRERSECAIFLTPKSNGSFFIKAFLVINPGIFIAIFMGITPIQFIEWILFLVVALISGLAALVFKSKTAHFNSIVDFQKFLHDKEMMDALERKKMLDHGLMIQNSDGSFSFTEKYHEQIRARASSRSSSSSFGSSSSRSSSSSSGGGRSGGGGASSSW